MTKLRKLVIQELYDSYEPTTLTHTIYREFKTNWLNQLESKPTKQLIEIWKR